MAEIELIMPKMGESVAEATITKWLKNEGDTIDLEESVLEIATDKVDSEVPSPTEGVLKKKLFNEDDVVQVGTAIAIIETAGENGQAAPKAVSESAPAAAVEAEKMVTQAQTTTETTEIAAHSGDRFYSPLVRSIAAEEGISQQELDAIPGTGSEGRVNKKDILDYLEKRQKGETTPSAAPAPSAQQTQTAPSPQKAAPAPVTIERREGDELIEMDRMRKLIADHMVNSKQTSPHVTSFVEADVTNLVKWREKVKRDFETREGEKLTFTPIFIEALAKTIRDFPMINISVQGTTIVKRRDINIGMAAALPSGNLIVPVIKRADQLNLIGLAKAVNDLARRARENKLKPEEIQGGTYTLTNVGTFGNVLGTPIINQPQVAIMAAGAIVKRPVVVETPQGDVIAIRHMMYLSHSYDHRVVDGALGGMFVRKLADYLEAFDINREI